ncbi:MAG: rhodanese-like domain-containing protein [Planctomycetes bacterium]|nr:rhodanese-like domain-containing protein [Planctomycetota bacterium]
MVTGGYAYCESNLPKQEATTQIIEDITPKDAFTLKQKNKGNPSFIILDVRTPEEFAEGHIEDAIMLDFYSETFNDELKNLDKNKTYIVHCRSGKRSKKTLNKMRELGFKEAYNLLDGMQGWEKEGLPTVR